MALLLGIEVDKIYLYPFGGIAKFNMNINERITKEFLVLIMGPIFQIIGYITLSNMSFFCDYIKLIKIYHYTILFFNLLPIYPLDGGRLICLLLSTRISFKRSIKLTIYSSYVIVIGLFIYNLCIDIRINIIVLFCFLLYKIRLEYKNINYIFDRFILERYLNKYKFKKRRIVNSIDSFVRDNYHIIKIENNYITEKSYLANKFHK